MRPFLFGCLIIVGLIPVYTQASACSRNLSGDPTVRAYFRKSIEQQEADFNSYNFYAQYEIFLYGHECVHPPLTDSAEYLARNGPDAVEFLKHEIGSAEESTTTDEVGTANKEYRIIIIISVFYQMNRIHSYDVFSDKDLMKFLRNAAKSLTIYESKDMARLYLEGIIETAPKSP